MFMELGAKRRSLYSTLLSTIVFHALQDSLKLWSNKDSNKRSWVSNAVSTPIFTFTAVTNKFGTKTFNCTYRFGYNTSGSITWDWRDLLQSNAPTPISFRMRHIYHMNPTFLKCGREVHLNSNIQDFWISAESWTLIQTFKHSEMWPRDKPKIKYSRFLKCGRELNLNTNIQAFWNVAEK
jgi:hypothetical protein